MYKENSAEEKKTQIINKLIMVLLRVPGFWIVFLFSISLNIFMKWNNAFIIKKQTYKDQVRGRMSNKV